MVPGAQKELDDESLDAIVDAVFGDDDEDGDDSEDEDLHILVCQYCGRTRADNETARRTWFVDSHVNYPDVFIVRCPRHISDWARKQTRKDKT